MRTNQLTKYFGREFSKKTRRITEFEYDRILEQIGCQMIWSFGSLNNSKIQNSSVSICEKSQRCSTLETLKTVEFSFFSANTSQTKFTYMVNENTHQFWIKTLLFMPTVDTVFLKTSNIWGKSFSHAGHHRQHQSSCYWHFLFKMAFFKFSADSTVTQQEWCYGTKWMRYTLLVYIIGPFN